MPSERFYIDSSLTIHSSVTLEGPEFHHLNVLRMNEDDTLELVNGLGILANATIKKIHKRFVELSIFNIYQELKDENFIILAQAIPKLNRLDTILEKGTELGVSSFWLFPGEHSQKSDFSENQLLRMRNITIAAMKQCGRLYLPDIVLKEPLEQWQSLPGTAYFGDLDPHAPLFCSVYASLKKMKEIIFFVGPETGFSDKELLTLKSLGAQGVKLHNNVLRTDTAAIIGIGLIQHFRYKDMK